MGVVRTHALVAGCNCEGCHYAVSGGNRGIFFITHPYVLVRVVGVVHMNYTLINLNVAIVTCTVQSDTICESDTILRYAHIRRSFGIV